MMERIALAIVCIWSNLDIVRWPSSNRVYYPCFIWILLRNLKIQSGLHVACQEEAWLGGDTPTPWTILPHFPLPLQKAKKKRRQLLGQTATSWGKVILCSVQGKNQWQTGSGSGAPVLVFKLLFSYGNIICVLAWCQHCPYKSQPWWMAFIFLLNIIFACRNFYEPVQCNARNPLF